MCRSTRPPRRRSRPCKRTARACRHLGRGISRLRSPRYSVPSISTRISPRPTGCWEPFTIMRAMAISGLRTSRKPMICGTGRASGKVSASRGLQSLRYTRFRESESVLQAINNNVPEGPVSVDRTWFVRQPLRPLRPSASRISGGPPVRIPHHSFIDCSPCIPRIRIALTKPARRSSRPGPKSLGASGVVQMAFDNNDETEMARQVAPVVPTWKGDSGGRPGQHSGLPWQLGSAHDWTHRAIALATSARTKDLAAGYEAESAVREDLFGNF